jgi:non-homologous end joining protein Ku
MRQRSTRERRHEREEFVYMYREEITRLYDKGTKDIAVKDFADRVARHALEYSNTTYYVDIWLNLRRDYKRLFNLPNW